MTLDQFVRYATALIPAATFAALFVSVFIFVRYKGTIDALKEAVETYKTLSEAYCAQVEQLTKDVREQNTEIEKLKMELDIQKKAARQAVDETIAGFLRLGYCPQSQNCKVFKELQDGGVK